MSAALAAIRQLLDLTHTFTDLGITRAKLGAGQLGDVDHGLRTVTLCLSVSEPDIAAEVLTYQFARLRHGPGRDAYALKDTLQQLVPPEEEPLSELRIEELAAHLNVGIEAIQAALVG